MREHVPLRLLLDLCKRRPDLRPRAITGVEAEYDDAPQLAAAVKELIREGKDDPDGSIIDDLLMRHA